MEPFWSVFVSLFFPGLKSLGIQRRRCLEREDRGGFPSHTPTPNVATLENLIQEKKRLTTTDRNSSIIRTKIQKKRKLKLILSLFLALLYQCNKYIYKKSPKHKRIKINSIQFSSVYLYSAKLQLSSQGT